MARLFSDPAIEIYTFDDLPLDEQMVLVDEKWLADYDRALSSLDDVYGVAPGTTVIVSARTAASMEMTLYFVQQRYHRVKVTLPRSDFVVAAGRRSHDVDPFVFVRSEWYERLHLKQYSVFAFIDAIGVKEMLLDGALIPDRLMMLRDRIDSIAADHPEVAFVSFADSLLLKSDWTIGHYERGVWYTYAPEQMLRLLPVIRKAFREALGLGIYAAMTQGANEYDEASALHVSPSRNHVSLNTLGLPFAQLMAIDHAVAKAIKSDDHPRSELYLDSTVYFSLRFVGDFERNGRRQHPYTSRLSREETYVCLGIDNVLANLRAEPL